jgi:two-component system, cell cycle sensor histidine kinase and response regulator CckA
MRSEFRLVLQPLQALLTQNQLRFCGMARIEALQATAAGGFSVLRRYGLNSIPLALGLLLAVAVGALAWTERGIGESIVLGLLALLAVAGVVLVLGLVSGFLRLSERAAEAEMLKCVADEMDNALQIVGSGGTVLYSNRALDRLTGRRSGRRMTLEELFVNEPQTAEAFYRLNRAAERREARDEEIFVISGTLAGKSGRWLQISVRPIQAAASDGDHNRLTLWQVSDVTRERAREAEAISSLKSTLSFYDDLPQGLFAAAADGRIVHVNSTLAQWLGLRPELNRALALADIVSAEGVALIRAAARAGRVTRFNLDLLREDGRAFPAHLICRGHGQRGVVSVLVLAQSDVQPEKDGGAVEAHLKRLLEAAPFGIAMVGTTGDIVTNNAAFMRMFFVEGRDAPANVADLIANADERGAAELGKAFLRACSGRAGATPVEVFTGPRGEFARRIYVSPLVTGARTSEGAILYVIDATEQKALELKFAHSHKMEAVGQLAGGVAHDFNNVLTAIIGFSDLLLQTHRPTDHAYRDIMNIKSSANRAAGLVRQLLAYSRRQTLQAEVLELGEVITDLSALLNKALGEKISLKILPGRDLWHVKADKTQFEHVIINLAVNARDAMPDGGCLTIRTRNVSERESLKLAGLGMTAGEYLLVEVEDTGVGIPPDVIGRIFEPFFTTKEVGKGTGLGLSTVYGIVKQTGGYIFADSEVGKGTTFRVYLPRHIVEHEDELPQRPKKTEPTRDLTGTGRVLLVEDEDVVRSFAVRALLRQGYEVLEAGTGLEAIEVMQRENHRVDIVVSDVIMPEMDGPTLLKELRKINPALKFIFVSGYPDDAFKKSLDADQEYAFLPKPFTLPQLAAKVKEQLGR